MKSKASILATSLFRNRSPHSILNVEFHASITALSYGFPRRLMLQTRPRPARIPLVILAGIGAPLVRVVEEADLGAAPLDGHLERSDREVPVVHRRQRPADDELRVQVEDDGEEELAVAGEQLRRVTDPLLVRRDRKSTR